MLRIYFCPERLRYIEPTLCERCDYICDDGADFVCFDEENDSEIELEFLYNSLVNRHYYKEHHCRPKPKYEHAYPFSWYYDD